MENKIGTRIKHIREGKNYTQEYMSSKLNISQNTYSKLESGGIKLTTDRLKEISEILEIPVENLLKDDLHIFNVHNSHIDKFYIENLREENKDLYKKLSDQNIYLQTENERLLKVIEKLSDKLK